MKLKPQDPMTWIQRFNLALEDRNLWRAPHWTVGYGFAILVSFLVYLTRERFQLGMSAPYVLFTIATALSSFYGGFGPGILATIITAGIINYFYIPPFNSFSVAPLQLLGTFLYIVEGFVIASIIDGQNRAKDEVSHQREWFHVTLEGIGDAVIATDTKGQVTYMNGIAQQLTGWTFIEAVGKKINKIFVLLNEQTQKPTDNPVHAVLKDGKVRDLANHTVLISKNNSPIPIDDSAAPIRNRNGKIIGVVMVFHDVSAKKQSQRQMEFMARSSSLLSSSLDYKKTLQSVAKLAVPHIADWCSIYLTDENGVVNQVALSHVDRKKIQWALKFNSQNPPDPNQKTGVYNVIRTGKPEVYETIPVDHIKQAIKEKPQLKIIEKLNLTSAMTIPILVGKKAMGAISFVTAESGRHYTETDVHLAKELCARASLAIENARLFSSAQNERKRLRELVANVPGIVWEAYGQPDDSTQRISFVNDHIETMLGYTVEEWLSTPNFWLTIVHPDDKESAAKETADMYASGKGGVSRFRWLAKDGRTIWVEAQSFVICDENGTPIGMRGVTMDITPRMELEQRKDEFISMASHELKTPLTSLKVYTQLLERQMDRGGQPSREPITKMGNQIDKLSYLINDLLDLSRIQSGKLQFRVEEFDLNELSKEIIETIQPSAHKHTITLEGSVKKIVQADRDRIGQVIINLITNAIKYSPQADKVVVRLASDENSTTVAVQDFGMGIAKQHHARVFDRFYQVDDQDTKTYPGLGIGLYISSEIIQRHNGTMWVESEKGAGATFFFRIPLRYV